jgi:hypothetical protein
VAQVCTVSKSDCGGGISAQKKEATVRKVKAAKMKKAAVASQPLSLPTIGSADVSTTSVIAPPPQVPVSIHDQIRAMKRAKMQAEKQLALLRRSRANPAGISYEQWLDATDGTDAPTLRYTDRGDHGDGETEGAWRRIQRMGFWEVLWTMMG